MKKWDLHNIKSIIKYIIYTASVVTACYGFWGSFFPELTLVEGTCRIVSGEEQPEDAEQLYADILDDKVIVTYRSKLWEIFKNKCGYNND